MPVTHKPHYSSYRCFGIPALIALAIFVTISTTLFLTMSESTPRLPKDPASSRPSKDLPVHFHFSAPQTYFLPSLPNTDPATFSPITTNFGLIHQSYPSDSLLASSTLPDRPTDWQRFAHYLHTLNSSPQSPANTSHHILFLSRHGQGYHNLAESYYGTNAWDCYFAELAGDPDPDSNITWVDASLSKLGLRQAAEQHTFWTRQYEVEKMPNPKSWWVSPMERAARTAQITHGFGSQGNSDVESGSGSGGESESGNSNGDRDPRVVTVKEFLRETNGIHTCDQRGSRSGIASRYPSYTIEPNFTENDELWDPVYRETNEAHTYRAKILLDDILGGLKTKEDGDFLSLTAHGGMINALLRAVGHREFQVQVGSAIAIYVVAEKIEGGRPEEKFAKGGTKPGCIGDPLKAGLPGFRSLREYVDSVEAAVEPVR